MNILKALLDYILSFFKKKQENIITELTGGLLGIGEQETDYIFGSVIDMKKEVERRGHIEHWVKYEYNQGAQYETRNWCTIYSAVTEVSWLMDYKYTLAEILVIGRKMIREGWLDPDRGAYLHKAIDYVRNDWNEKHPKRKIVSYRISYDDEELRDYITYENARLTQLGYRTSIKLYNEIQATGMASEEVYPKEGGHAVSQWGLNTINNYYGKKMYNGKLYRNRFEFVHMDELIENGIIYNIGYIFLKDID